jgi:hypothetical protein
MIDVTSPKVLAPALLFAVLSPGLLLTVGGNKALYVHAVVLALALFVIYKFVLKRSVTTADLLVPALLFVLLTPGVLVTLPSGSSKALAAIGVHTLIFAILFAFLRSAFPRYY